MKSLISKKKLLSSLAVGLAMSGFSKTETKPNVVFFLVDDLGWKDIGVNGAKLYETPNIDKLCNNGMRFTSAYTSARISSPPRASVLTGRHPLKLKMWHAYHYLKPKDSKKMLPKLLKEKGYDTWHVGKWHLGNPDEKTMPTDVGFDVNIGGGISWGPGSYFWPYKTKEDGTPMGHPRDHAPLRKGGFEGEQLTDRLTREAVNLINNHKSDKPVYLNLWYYSVHNRKEAKKDLIEKYKKKIAKMGIKESHRVYMGDSLLTSETNAMYAAMLETVDNSVGEVVKALKVKGMYENTLFVFYSDNGPTTDDVPCAPLMGGKNTTYEAGVRMPAFFTWKNHIQKNSVSDYRIIIMDVFNTICEATGIEIPKQNDGVSLINHFKGEPVKARDFYWYFPDTRRMYGGRASAAILDQSNWKYIYFYKGYESEVYDINVDIAEQNNLYSNYKNRVGKMEAKLADFLDACGYSKMKNKLNEKN
jgi:arylsulfatase A-like enzyme